MPNFCVVPNCKGCYRRGLITLHSFPKDPKRRKEWESKVRKPNFMATNNHKICSQHFERECFEPLKTGGTWLKPDAVPTIFDLVMPESSQSVKKSNGKKSSTKRKESGDESSTKRIIKNKRLCYLGDFDEATVISPENARKMLARAKAEVESKTKEIRSLRKENRKLKKRVATVIKMLYELKEKHIIAGDASSI